MGATRQAQGCETPEECGVSRACKQGGLMPCVEVARAHRDEQEIADALDLIAESLNTEPDRFACLRVASLMLPRLRSSQAYEEATVFPAMQAQGPAPALQSLAAEHVEGDWNGQDITDLLLAVGRGESMDDPEAAGMRLRAFAASLRRHVANEREHLLPGMPLAR